MCKGIFRKAGGFAILPLVNCEAVVVDENDNEDGDSMADTVLVIVVHDVIEFWSQLWSGEYNFPCFMDKDIEVTESKGQPGIPSQ